MSWSKVLYLYTTTVDLYITTFIYIIIQELIGFEIMKRNVVNSQVDLEMPAASSTCKCYLFSGFCA